MKEVFPAILERLEHGEPVVRVAVMHSTGSTPRSAGACMAVFTDGTAVGTIGGGLVEHASQQAAATMQPGTSAVREFDLTANDAAAQGMICGGAMTVLLDSMEPNDDIIDFTKAVLDKLETGDTAAIDTVLSPDRKVLKRTITANQAAIPQTTHHEDGIFFTEPLPRPRTVHFIGAGHVAQATARIAALTGFHVAVIDDRDDFANEQRFPDAVSVEVTDSLKQCLPNELGFSDHVVIMTRGHLHDRDVLAQALKTNAGYIGMIGSKKKKAAVYESLLDEGFTQADLNRVHCPIGLSIGADTPEEIAISIVGELIATHKG